MAFGIKRGELKSWKNKVENGDIAFLTHYWLDDRFPNSVTVTKVGCNDVRKLKIWGEKHGLQSNWIHHDPRFPHFDLFGDRQREILVSEKKWDQINKFKL